MSKAKSVDVQIMGREFTVSCTDEERQGLMDAVDYLEKKMPKEGSIEHAEWQSKMNDVNGLADIILGKQRHGPTGTVKVEFEGIYTKFKDLSKN